MALTKTLPTQDAGGLSITDTRLVMAGLVAQNADGTPRPGILAGAATLVTGKTSMAYDVAPFKAALSRIAGGVELVANDAVMSVATTAAPSANSRLDVIYVRSRFTQHADGSNVPEFGVAKGTAAAIPTKPAIPAGALELATAEITSTTTTTGTAVITQSAPFTAAAGGVVPFRNPTAMLAASGLADGVMGRVGADLYVIAGGKWGPVAPMVRKVAATAAGSLTTAVGYINLHPDQSIPASPFGVGVPYDIIADAYVAAGAGNGVAIRVRVDGAEAATGAFALAVNTVGLDNYARTHAVHEITNPDVAHTVNVMISAQAGPVTVRSGAALCGTVLTLQRRTVL